MRVRSLLLAAAFALAAPLAANAADMADYVPPAYAPGPACSSLDPVAFYVPPQQAYIVACRQGLRPVITRRLRVKWYEEVLVYYKGWEPTRPPVDRLIVPR